MLDDLSSQFVKRFALDHRNIHTHKMCFLEELSNCGKEPRW